ncbi:hypothetical protein COU15_02685 [Candidatus Kaiserbacteria bacterium CG10_big_fil_rev_8_21_14_0_10_45_20]|uniref:Uncharacterized protein n=1 Tax=Candidatus Kaiserbacteria bacterium CG10_big_fil_rev_8_21_14_0_10_45_20 TaxID=1974607 RepID=A0A2H0UHA1_9BACT|nr:MAG: hypothetical protein COU15_02685 [Candidatus Kaiserbacteria bacterium CG10_big_fil_rev_8_21_14_0_10_45_20]
MESLFPEIFFLSFFVPLILRIAIAIIFFLDAKALWQTGGSRAKMFALKKALFGLLLAVGFLTQLVAILGILVVLGRRIWLGKGVAPQSLSTNILTVGALLSLLILGAGAFAIDLPY